MEKRLWSILLFSLILVFVATLVVAQNETIDTAKVNQAYKCLSDKVTGNCDSLSLQEKTFSLLALDQCKPELIGESENDGECWPSGGCKIKDTAQSALALDATGSQTIDAQNWLIAQNTTPKDINWYLEIDTSDASSCKVDYSGFSYVVNVNADKTLSNGAGSCLSLSTGNYWLQVSPSCLDTQFEVSCDAGFLTTLLFQESGSSTVHVTSQTSSASADGTTMEKVNSFCFSNPGNNACDYEGSLWAALVLDSFGQDISPYLPYLIVKAPDNERLLPEAFLYILTGNEDYRSSLLLKQKSSQYWAESGDRYYDTALALYPLQNEEPQEKKDSKEWLLSSQDSEGCWQGSIRDTGFLLASVWPKNYNSGSSGGGLLDCENSGYYCMSGASCDGEILDEYSCPSLFRCCSQPQNFETCSELNGEICASNQICQGGDTTATADLTGNELCCIGGFCETVTEQPQNQCEDQGGVCRFTCESGEQDSSYDCGVSGAVCCIFEDTGSGTGKSSGGSYWWIWTLLVLIVLVVVGIIFRDKLRSLWLRIKSKFGKDKGSSQGPSSQGPFPRFPSHPRPGPRPHPATRPVERRILLPSTEPSRPKPNPKPLKKSRTQKELDDVLKKLKDMSK